MSDYKLEMDKREARALKTSIQWILDNIDWLRSHWEEGDLSEADWMDLSGIQKKLDEWKEISGVS